MKPDRSLWWMTLPMVAIAISAYSTVKINRLERRVKFLEDAGKPGVEFLNRSGVSIR